MSLIAVGKWLVVEKEATQDSGFVIEGALYSKGKVVSSRSDLVEYGSTIVYPSGKDRPVGLGFDSNTVIVHVDDVHAIVEK